MSVVVKGEPIDRFCLDGAESFGRLLDHVEAAIEDSNMSPEEIEMVCNRLLGLTCKVDRRLRELNQSVVEVPIKLKVVQTSERPAPRLRVRYITRIEGG